MKKKAFLNIAKVIKMFNLQLFAEPNTNVTTDAGLSGEMKTYYEDTLIDEAEPNLVHDQFGDKYPIPKGKGKTIEFRKYDSLPKALTPLTEGVTPNGKKLSMTTTTAEIAQYGDYIVTSDVLDLTAIDNNVIQSTKVLGSQAGRTLDTVTREVLAGGTNVLYAPKISGGAETIVSSRKNLDTTALITPDLCFQAHAILKTMLAPFIDGCYVGIIHPYVAYDLMRNEEWLDVHKYSTPENIYEGEIGKIANIRFVQSTEAKIWKDATCPTGLAVFSTLILGAHAYGVTEVQGGGLQHIVKQLGYGDDPLNQRASVGWKATKTAKRLVEQYMLRIESCSKKYSSIAEAN